MVAPAQGGTHANGRKTYGHSLIVGPWGDILAEAGTDPGAQRRLTEGAPERTFEAVAQHYLAGMERKVLLKKRSPATLRKARWALRDYIYPFLGPKPIDSISSQELLVVLKKIETKGSQLEVQDDLPLVRGAQADFNLGGQDFA